MAVALASRPGKPGRRPDCECAGIFAIAVYPPRNREEIAGHGTRPPA